MCCFVICSVSVVWPLMDRSRVSVFQKYSSTHASFKEKKKKEIHVAENFTSIVRHFHSIHFMLYCMKHSPSSLLQLAAFHVLTVDPFCHSTAAVWRGGSQRSPQSRTSRTGESGGSCVSLRKQEQPVGVEVTGAPAERWRRNELN